jgi:hypothetical protein
LVSIHEGKRSAGRLRCEWKNNIKVDSEEMVATPCRFQWWVLLNKLLKLWVPEKADFFG